MISSILQVSDSIGIEPGRENVGIGPLSAIEIIWHRRAIERIIELRAYDIFYVKKMIIHMAIP